MFNIGDFAALGRVSVRMLRHYDAIGLLRPARVDPATGYRYYAADQLSRLNRVIALKDLGFTLQQVQAVLEEKVDVTELRGMLRLRRAQLADQLAADTARLLRVEARLRLIESEGHMDTAEVVLRRVPAIRVAELSAVAASYAPEHIGPALTPLYPQLLDRMRRAGTEMTGAPIAYYDGAPDASADAVTVHAAFPVSAVPAADPNLTVVELPGIEYAATLVHHGPMDDADRSMQVLARWIDDNGYRPVGAGYAREVYLDYHADRPEEGVTELQIAVTRP
ncbi:MerR family transcriptional regulator [Micromonospora sp. NPDC049559]|uniref:MerR family transcriptional regulator n=1 Tax=Micromonospora sp. NPDC049559 TaxID=3155923 RepID=UPI0034126FFA